MVPIDYRNATFSDLKSRLSGLRIQVYQAFLDYGPGTTKQIADRSGLSLLTLRPRTTELLDLGFVELIGGEGHEGIYRARSMAEVEAFHHARVRDLADPQLAFSL
jgi:hypothetical protein